MVGGGEGERGEGGLTMTLASTDKVFAGSIPQVYQSHMVPLIFEPYAVDLAGRAGKRKVSRVLEIAAGTGVVTRALDRRSTNA